MKTIVLVDIQNDFVEGGALAVPHGNQIVPLVNTILDDFDRVIATQDWHPADHASVLAHILCPSILTSA